MGFRSISYKTIFFNFLASLKKDKKKELEKNLGTLNSSIKKRTWNNQPFDIDNFEALYFYFCTLLSIQIKDNSNKLEIYFQVLNRFTSMLKGLDDYIKNDNYEIEKNDIKKFLRIIFAILNLDSKNYQDISQVAKILDPPDPDEQKEMISVASKQIKKEYGSEIAEKFKIEMKKNNNFFYFEL